ncbi:Tyrosine recombinase XerC [bioreactor metagenome]|uniref:Tyrosine recombinase XerC n=1 Tax=bioreactor metagenome TaxID=1076179 RepID=A0A644YWL8_9ZZZZ
MNIKRNVIFALESRKKDGKSIVENVPIRMRVVYNNQRVEFTTGYRIDVSKWDAEKQRVKNGCTNKLKQTSAEINSDLSNYFTEIQNIFKEFEVKDEMPTTVQLREVFNLATKKMDTEDNSVQEKPVLSFWKVFNEFVSENSKRNNWANGTLQKFNALKKHIEKWKSEPTMDDFSEKGLSDFADTLYKQDLKNSTIDKQIGLLKWVLRWSASKNLTSDNAFLNFKPKLKTARKTVVFLDAQELKQLTDFEIPEDKKYLEKVRDIFLFCCYTSLRYSDVCNLCHSNIKGSYIDIVTIKTNDRIVIEFNDKSKAIYEKYKDFHFEGGKVFPVISNQKMNDYLKDLAELAGLDNPVHQTHYKGNERIETILPKYAVLSTHDARRTFICNALSLGIPANVVMKWTGHSDYKAMKPYIDIADDIKASAMSKFNQL